MPFIPSFGKDRLCHWGISGLGRGNEELPVNDWGQREIKGSLNTPLPVSVQRGKIKHVAGSFISTAPLSHDIKTQRHTHTHRRRPKHTSTLSYPLLFLTLPMKTNIWSPLIDVPYQTVTKCSHYINLYVWQYYWLGWNEPIGECIKWCQGWIDRQALTHSALQRDHMLTPCQSEREETINTQRLGSEKNIHLKTLKKALFS